MAGVLCCACGCDAGSGTQPQIDSAREAPQASIELPEQLQGQRAIDLLGDNLSQVASRYGKSAEELRELLLRDRTLWVDRAGNLVYQETPPQAGAQ